MTATAWTSDAAEAAARVGSRWEGLRDARLFVTGGTGFIGTWLLSTLHEANRRLGLGARAVVLTRDPAAFACRAPHLVDEGFVDLLAGDVRDFAWPEGRFTHAINGAAAADAALAERDPDEVESTIVDGARRVLELCRARGVRRLLALSSGAVYRQPIGVARPLHEDDSVDGGPPGSGGVYHRAKRRMESVLGLGAGPSGGGDAPAVVVARLFAFVGPGLPLDRHFAIGNFIADALAGGPIVVHGDGTPVRSYLYTADAAAWLWTLMAEGRPGRAYNVGSERAVTIAQVARMVAGATEPPLDVRFEGLPGVGGGGSWYVPDTRQARDELGLDEWTSLEGAVRRTIAYQRDRCRKEGR